MDVMDVMSVMSVMNCRLALLKPSFFAAGEAC